MTLNKSYFVDPVLDETVAGFNCHCFLNQKQVDRRFFRDFHHADDYGKEWLESKYSLDE